MSNIKTKLELLQELEKFSPIVQAIDAISERVIKDESERSAFSEIKKKIGKWKQKLSNPKFEVAIIGLEKAGKSTIANALLNQDYLPSAKARCTFTTAQIEADKLKNEAIIEFYTTKEFLQRFDALCEKLKIKKQDFNTLDIEKFSKIIKEQNYIQEPNEVKDIEIMLQNREELYNYIDKPIEVITTNLKENVKPFIISEDRAMAVKSIIIKSTELKDLENIIIYDVPGFDSPTKLHLEQAKKYTDEADVVIMMVSIADRVSFTDTQVNFLNQTAQDGVSLIDKTIVIASKFDSHIIHNNKRGSEAEIEEYVEILNGELKKHKIYREKNIFKVSAIGYLEKNKKIEEDQLKGYIALPKLESINMDDGYHVFRKRLTEFFEYDALRALNDNIIKDFNMLENFLIEFKQKHNIQNNEIKLKKEIYKLKQKYKSNSKESIRDIVIEHKEQILNKGDFNINSDFIEQVNTEWIEKLTITDSQRELDIKKISSDGINKAQKYNNDKREELYKKSLKIINKVVSKVVIEKDKKVIEDFKNALYKYFEIEGNRDIKKDLDKTLENIMNEFIYDEKSYKPLIARFINDIFKVLIDNPISTDVNSQRVQSFKKIKQDIESLLPFDKNYQDELDLGVYEKVLVKKILVQYEELSLKQIKEELVKYKKYLGEKVNLENLADELKDINISPKLLKNSLESQKDKFKNLTKDSIVSLIQASKSKNSLDVLMDYAQEATSYEEVQEEINRDLVILKDIISNILIKAIRIDKPFLDSLNNQIEAIRRDVNDENSEFDRFMDLHIEILDRENYNTISADPELMKKISDIVANINGTI